MESINAQPAGSTEFGDKRIGQILIETSSINVKQLSDAIIAQERMKTSNGRRLKIGEILLFTEIIKLDELQNALRLQQNRANQSRTHAVEARSKEEARSQASAARAASRARKKATETETSFVGRIFRLFKK